jgi:predicted nuclease of predicted toxin-antitoxin system
VILWVDAQLSPALAPWLTTEFGIEAFSARHLNFVRAKDRTIFAAAREARGHADEDVDVVLLQERFEAYRSG